MESSGLDTARRKKAYLLATRLYFLILSSL